MDAIYFFKNIYGVNMKFLLQVDFPHQGPFGDELTNAMSDLAKDIANEKGLIYKLWIENEETKEAGGTYVFDNKEDASRYLEMHTKRLESFGYSDIKAKIFTINEDLSRLSKAEI
ncbi:putative monooxygenase, YdhR family [Sulfurimonas gotlandica GD1]|uniref:Putative monooxygenase, YdhR family n=2 Tax=Sulfurimonas TaxID=202746 RepID=B6BGI8_SULGG|nr:protein YdhR [Sulfurimonas gotlandica GD1]EHP29616.1 putative monooxygenase, YdhR family [Sulfurimonas gotlandica GD1]